MSKSIWWNGEERNMNKLLRWIIQTKSNAMWRLGLTHQFHCKKCGAPIDEEPVVSAAGKMWRWKCDFCGWRAECHHAPRVMRLPHQRVVILRKLMWRGKHD